MTSYERTGWRDESISRRHRQWGFNCPAVDLDFLMVEYNLGEPVALVEYKRYTAQTPNVSHPTYRALTRLCDGYRYGPLAFFLAYYWPEIWAVRVESVNGYAREFYGESRVLCERDFVSTLYELRRLKVDDFVLRGLNTTLPHEVAA